VDHSLYLYLERIEHKLDRLLTLAQQTLTVERSMSLELDRLTASVAAEGDVVASVEKAIDGLKSQVADLAARGGTPEQFTDLANQLDAYRDRLAKAVATNTVAAGGGGDRSGAPQPAQTTSRKP
jgi:uncharacterized protein involved in exopolysaccharide biosynthesis